MELNSNNDSKGGSRPASSSHPFTESEGSVQGTDGEGETARPSFLSSATAPVAHSGPSTTTTTPRHSSPTTAAYEEVDGTSGAEEKPEIIEDSGPPVPPAFSAAFEENENASETKQKPEIIEGDDFQVTDQISAYQGEQNEAKGVEEKNQGALDGHVVDPIPDNPSDSVQLLHTAAQAPPSDGETVSPSMPTLEATLVQGAEATLIPNDPVYDAVPIQPRSWSKRHINYFIGCVGLLAVSLATALGFSLGSTNGNESSESMRSVLPSMRPSLSPSPSQVPSSRPSFRPSKSASSAPSQVPTSHPSFQPSSVTWKQVNQAIVGEKSNDWLGNIVSLSADGKTLAIGAPGYFTNEDRPGYVKVYHMDNHIDKYGLIQRISGESLGDYAGWAMALSADSNTVAVGALYSDSNGEESGQVKVYRREDNGLFNQIGDTIMGEAPGDRFGSSVSLSADGNILAVGAPRNGSNGTFLGQVTVYIWDTIELVYVPHGRSINGDFSGDLLGWHSTSIALAADGNTLAIGSIGRTGFFKVYRWNESSLNYEQMGSIVTGKRVQDDFGYSLIISADGNIVGVGAPGTDAHVVKGYAQIYMWVDNEQSWKQRGEDLVGETVDSNFGRAVALSADGMTFAVGARDEDCNGGSSGQVKVYVYDQVLSDYIQLGQSICGETADLLGWGISLSADGRTLAVGSPWNDSNGGNSGIVRVYNIEH